MPTPAHPIHDDTMAPEAVRDSELADPNIPALADTDLAMNLDDDPARGVTDDLPDDPAGEPWPEADVLHIETADPDTRGRVYGDANVPDLLTGDDAGLNPAGPAEGLQGQDGYGPTLADERDSRMPGHYPGE